MKLPADPRFPTVVRDVVYGFGPAERQPLLDRYVDGEDVSAEELRRWITATCTANSSPPSAI